MEKKRWKRRDGKEEMEKKRWKRRDGKEEMEKKRWKQDIGKGLMNLPLTDKISMIRSVVFSRCYRLSSAGTIGTIG